MLRTYQSGCAPVVQADIARYIILYVLGGVYTDVDNKCLKTIPDSFFDNDFFHGDKRWWIANNNVIGSVPYHPILKVCMMNCKNRLWCLNSITLQTPLICWVTGTYMFKTSIESVSVSHRIKEYKNTFISTKFSSPVDYPNAVIAHYGASENRPLHRPIYAVCGFIYRNQKIILILIILYIIYKFYGYTLKPM